MQVLQKQQVTQSAQNTVLMTVKNTDFKFILEHG